MKKTVSIILSICMLLSLTLTGCAAEQTQTQSNEATEIILQIGNPVMTVNGTEKPIDAEGTAPVIVNDRTLLPVRAVVEEMGGTVAWDGDTQTVTLNYGENEIRLIIDNTAAYLNDTVQTLDVAPTIINDRTMLPIRFIAESFNFEVSWDGDTQTVTITGNAAAMQTPSAPEATPAPTENPAPTDTPSGNEKEENKMLVVYFSATGTTKVLAETIAQTVNADISEIVPKVPYTSEDLNYNSDCRANAEQQDDSARPEFEPVSVNIDDYDTIFIGYPIWWGTMPKIINTFLEAYDMSGKTIMPFCTSGGSGIETSVSAIRSICTNADVKNGMRGTASASNAQIETWIESNN